MSKHRTHFKVAVIMNIVIFSLMVIAGNGAIIGSFNFIPIVYSLIVGGLAFWLYRTKSWIPPLFMICFCLVSAIPLFISDTYQLEEEIGGLYMCASFNFLLGLPAYIYTFIIMLVFRKRFVADKVHPNDYGTKESVKFREKNPADHADKTETDFSEQMLSQYAARYAFHGSEADKDHYIGILGSLGFTEEEALKLLAFEGDVIRKYNKVYLLHPDYCKMWLFGLEKPCFSTYPCEKEDILKEHSMTLSEICKTIDEAEWHYWNSHEKDISDDVWEEIVQWHLRGAGGDFALKYFDMISEGTGIPKEKILKYSSHEGIHLKNYKWRA